MMEFWVLSAWKVSKWENEKQGNNQTYTLYCKKAVKKKHTEKKDK